MVKRNDEIKSVYEGATGYYKATLKDKNGNIIGPDNISYFFVTIFDERSDEIISTTDAYNGGSWGQNVTLSTATRHNLEITLSSADNAIYAYAYMGEPFTYLDENHIIHVKGKTAGSPVEDFRIKYKYMVENSRRDG